MLSFRAKGLREGAKPFRAEGGSREPGGGARLKAPENSVGGAKQVPSVRQGVGARCQSTEEAGLKHKPMNCRTVFLN